MINESIKTSKLKNTCIVFFMNLIFSCIFYNAHYWTDSTSFGIKLRTYIVFVFLLIIVPLFVFTCNSLNEKINNINQKILIKINNIKNNWQQFAKIIFSVIIIVVISFFLSMIVESSIQQIIVGFENNIIFNIVFVAFSLFTYTVYYYRNSAYQNIHKLFFILAMIEGMLFCFIVPTEVGISWDDEIHFQNVTNIVDYFNGTGFKADDLLVEEYQSVAIEHYGYSLETRQERENELNQSFQKREIGSYSESYSISYLAYIPYVIGMLFCRGLNLSFTLTFQLSKILNFILYTCVCAFAIKKIKAGKVVMSFIALFPTAIYMACSYSYDPWIICFSLLGFSYYFNLFKDDEVTNKNLYHMLFFLIIAFLPKAVYFPALFPLLFVPKTKFKSKKQHNTYLFSVYISAFLLLLAIVMPILFSGNGLGSGDLRGGTDVNSTEQIKFILSEPFAYINILFNFLLMYLSPINSGQYMQLYAYMRYAQPFVNITIAVFIFVIIFDQYEKKNKTRSSIVAGWIGIISAVILVATSMYISFTPVRHPTINGCQFRYLIPLLFPSVYLFSWNRIPHIRNKNLFALLSIGFLVFSFMLWTSLNIYAGF